MRLRTTEDIENLRRSLAMLPPQGPAWNREQAIEVLTELQRLRRAIEQLRGAYGEFRKP